LSPGEKVAPNLFLGLIFLIQPGEKNPKNLNFVQLFFNQKNLDHSEEKNVPGYVYFLSERKNSFFMTNTHIEHFFEVFWK